VANNFHTIDGWHIVGIEGHNGLHIIPVPPFLVPMWFWKLTCMHPFTLGDKQKPTVMFNGVPSVTHQHEPTVLWPHIGIIPDPLDALTPLHLAFGSHKCWLPRGAVQICGEKSTCCVIGGPVSLNADCWEYGKWPTSLVLNPGTVQTTPTIGDFLAGAVTLAVDLLIDLIFEVAMKLGGALLKKLFDKAIKPLLKKGKELMERGLKAAMKQLDDMAPKLASGLRSLGNSASNALAKAKCFFTGHPVNATTGDVFDHKLDLNLPGAIPLTWERTYSSARATERTGLGRGGWTHNLEQWIEQTEKGIVFRDEQGRDLYLPAAVPGESRFHRADRLTLTARDGGRFDIFSHETQLTRRFEPSEPGGRAWLRSIHDVFGNQIFLEYSGGRLRRVIDTAGREVRVKMTAGGRIVRLEVWAGDHVQQWVDYSYAKMGELASATDALGHAEHYEYDEDHRMVKATLKNGVSFYYAYDPESGRCSKTWGDDGLHTAMLKYDLENRITRIEGNDEPRILCWNEDGLVVREETPDGIVIRTSEYDGDQYLVAEGDGDGAITRYEYDARGNRVAAIDPAGNVTRWEYERDLVVLRTHPDGLRTSCQYNEIGMLVGVLYPTEARYSMSYDNRGHVKEIRGDEGPLVTFDVDERHNVVHEVDARGAKTSYEYDRMGRPTLQTDALGRSSEILYDALGQAVSARRPDGTRTEYEFDALGKMTRVTDALGNVKNGVRRNRPAPQAHGAGRADLAIQVHAGREAARH
jgi:YD repeat-containing protein